MPTNNAGPTEVVAPVAPAATYTAPPRRLPGLAIAGITVGAVIVAGALFGGGILVGEHLSPARGGFGTHQGFPGGPNGFGNRGPITPGQGNDQRGWQGGPTGSGSGS